MSGLPNETSYNTSYSRCKSFKAEKSNKDMSKTEETYISSALVSAGDTTGARRDCALAIFPVRVKGSKYNQTYAFLDPGCTAMLCTENLMNQLNVKGRKTEIFL